jgi:hypothetical protein
VVRAPRADCRVTAQAFLQTKKGLKGKATVIEIRFVQEYNARLQATISTIRIDLWENIFAAFEASGTCGTFFCAEALGS